ncbi:biotin/acetyl-CoA-carboxylase ligase [Pseudodesulfovibrio mercurii]|uniref:Biotin/acetyl-CoA-carboxylase ligase n=1 Tax=Pseudodesulfovibrio mercurii TaxID=641491 RepID=F0JF75_9BACT|nr:biotin--[acetyl-CoA-carboxylase] ligase [Pseudodesulfovibrio mercurii]EGB13631.1 biotin/acetyl-CoA-carboxylase ligase [Pseudodesulfovibrio mercurii]
MLPQGIFLIKPTAGDGTAVHPLWQADLRAFGPWVPAVPEGADGDHVADPDGTEPGAVPEDWLRGSGLADGTVVVAEECATTMELAARLAADELLGPWGAVVCARQSRGRGQLRRPWASLAGNMHASIVLPPTPEKGPWAEAMSDLLPLVVGHVVSEVLAGLGAQVRIKWPNDILQDGRKVGGMLIEERNGTSVVGVGLNLADCPKDAQMREDHSVPAAKIGLPFFSGGPVALLGQLVNRGKSVYAVMLDEIPPPRFISMFESKLAWFGRTILVKEGDESSYEALLAGLSLNGGLVLRRGGVETVLYSGSIFPLQVPHGAGRA